MKKPLLLAATLALALATPAWAQRPEIDLSAVAPRVDTFSLRVDGREIGTQVVRLDPTPEGFRFRETTTTTAGNQTTEVLMDGSLEMRSVRQSGQMGGQAMRIAVEYGGGRAVGQARVPGPEGMTEREVDAAVPAGVLDDNVMLALLPGLAWAPQAAFELPVFASGMNALVTYRVQVVGREELPGPSGPVPALRVEMAGGNAPLVVHVAEAAPHEVLRLEVVGSPMQVVRAGSSGSPRH